MTSANAYLPKRPSRSRFVSVRGLNYHLQCWGDASMATPERPALFMLHGWMDVGASFQFLVDELASTSGEPRFIVAPDWRGFGLTRERSRGYADTYWFADYLADLDVLLDAAFEGDGDGSGGAGQGQAIDLLGHSMGGNVAMMYAGVRPERIRRLVNLEGFGMPDTRPQDAPKRYLRWLDELREPTSLRGYDSIEAVARRLQRNNPLLAADKALWLATQWATEVMPGRWELRADPAHKQTSPVLYRKEEVLAVWRQITAPMLWIEGDQTDVRKFWGNRYTREEFTERLAHVAKVQRQVVGPSGHMLHHDQPARVAELLDAFLAAPIAPA